MQQIDEIVQPVFRSLVSSSGFVEAPSDRVEFGLRVGEEVDAFAQMFPQ